MAFWTDVFLNKVRQDWLKRIVKIQYYAGGVWYDARYAGKPQVLQRKQDDV